MTGPVLLTVVSSGLALASLVTVRAPGDLTLEPGRGTEASIAIVIEEGFHIQANPAANEFLIPLTVAIEPAEGLTAGEPRYPPPRRLRLKGTDEDLLVYDGVVTVPVPVQASPSAIAGDHELLGRVGYQACDDTSCRPPATAPFEIRVRVRPRQKGR